MTGHDDNEECACGHVRERHNPISCLTSPYLQTSCAECDCERFAAIWRGLSQIEDEPIGTFAEYAEDEV